ncbi:YitT family protein [Thermoanaerobacterium thermosulfurigenes]|uniref:YitT family protein n=1 Tax=Thermoanaerobacterium thermosulfurigenes TaxID=33950 RepID=UPI003F4A2D52
MHKKGLVFMSEKVKKIVMDFIWITIGTLLLTLSLDLFLIPNQIAPGGVSGLAIVLNYILKLRTYKSSSVP